MGKYMRKAKITTGDIAVMEVSEATLGVRTRARTLALQRLQSSSSDSSSYLQLRSRRLEKPPTATNPKNQQSHSSQKSKSQRFLLPSVKSASVSITRTEDGNDFAADISFGENGLDFEPRDRSTTPCSLVRESDAMTSPGSVTRGTSLNATAQRPRNSLFSNFPSAHEIEEFFTFAEQQQQRLFMDKYNFDVVNDLPVPGHYEWIRVDY